MKWLLFLIPLLAFAYTPSDDREISTDFIESRNQTRVEMRAPLKGEGFAGSFAMETDADGDMSESPITSTELFSLDNITGNIQTQIDGKQSTLPATTAGDLIYFDGVDYQRLGLGTLGNLLSAGASAPSYVDGSSLFVDLTSSQTIAGSKTISGQFIAVSTTNGNRPCPVMTEAERDLIASPAEGDCIVNSTTSELNYYLASAWGGVGGDSLPDQTGQAGKYLQTDGSVASWQDVDALPDQTGQAGNFLVTDGTNASWNSELQGTLNPVTDWKIGTCTSTVTTNAVTSCRYRRIGDSIEVSWKILFSGPNTQGPIEVTIPDGLVLDTSKINTTTNFAATFGTGNYLGASAHQLQAYYDSTDGRFCGAYVRDQTAGINNTISTCVATDSNSPEVVASGHEFNLTAEFPVVGLSSGLDAVVTNNVTPKARFGATVDQAIPNNTETQIALNTSVYLDQITLDTGANTITITKSGFYQFSPLILLRNTSTSQPPANSRCFSGLEVISGPNAGKTEGFQGVRVGSPPNALWAYSCGLGSVVTELAAGDVIEFNVNHNFGSNVELVANNYIQVIEQLDTSVVVGAVDSQKWVCEYNYLSSDLTANATDIASLRFNLVPNGKYNLRIKSRFQFVNNDTYELLAFDNGSLECFVRDSGQNSWINKETDNCDFIAESSELNFNLSSVAAGNTLFGNGGKAETHAILCRLPDNYVIE